MITIYGTPSCPDCAYIMSQIEGNADYNFIDICKDKDNLKLFLKLRDTEAIFAPVIGNGIGIPSFVREDGSVTRIPEEVGLVSRPAEA